MRLSLWKSCRPQTQSHSYCWQHLGSRRSTYGTAAYPLILLAPSLSLMQWGSWLNMRQAFHPVLAACLNTNDTLQKTLLDLLVRDVQDTCFCKPVCKTCR